MLQSIAHPPGDDSDPGETLFLDVARRAIRNQARSTWLDNDQGRSFTVDDERSKVKAALDRLAATERAALVLSHFSGLPANRIQPALAVESRHDLRVMAERAAAQVANAGGRSPDAQIIDLLNRLLIDAPADDIWPHLDAPIRSAWAARKRRERGITLGVAASLLLIVVAGIVWLTGFRPWQGGGNPVSVATAPTSQATPNTTPTRAEPSAAFAAVPSLAPVTGPDGSVPEVADVQFLRIIEQGGDGRSELHFYSPPFNSANPLLAAGGQVLVSPDGQSIISERGLPDQPGLSVLAGFQFGGDDAWETRLAAPRALEIGNDVVYVLNTREDGLFQIQSLDLVSGSVTTSWPLAGTDARPSTLRSIRLILSPDGARLTVLAEQTGAEAERWIRSVTGYDPGTGEVTGQFQQEIDRPGEDGIRDFSVNGARKLAGQNVLYSAVPDAATLQVRLQFLDLDTGELSSLAVPMTARSVPLADQRGENEVHLVPSNTGAMLYVIQSRLRQVAVIDLRARNVIGVFPMTASEAEQAILESSLNRVSFMEVLLSPDGTWLYLAVNRERNQAINGYPSQSPIWVFNTTTWQVADRWMVGGLPRRMTMSGNGARIYVRSARADGSVHLTSFDTATGDTIDVWPVLPSPEWADIQRIVALPQIYHDQHGFRPRAANTSPRDNPIVAVLPGVKIDAVGALTGTETVITARVVDPIAGTPATESNTLRFDPEATVAIELSNGSQQAILVPSVVEPGRYEGRTRLNFPGTWDAKITIINRDGTTWTVYQPGAVDVDQGLGIEGGDGYRFIVRPANPVNRRTITLRVWLVEGQSGERLADDSAVADQIQTATIRLTHPEGGVVEETLERLDNDSFLAWVRFASAGNWSAEINLTLDNGDQITVGAGEIEIRDLTEAYRRTTSTTPVTGGATKGLPATEPSQ